MSRKLHRQYTYRVTWLEKEKKHLGRCAEFPGFEAKSSSVAGAIMRLIKLIEAQIDSMIAQGQKPPEPLIKRKYSGNFTIRTAPETHRKLAIKAAEQDVSLNHYVSNKLADF